MAGRLTPEQAGLRERARRLAQQAFAPRAAAIDRSEQYPWDNVAALKAAGLLGMPILPHADG